MEMKKKNMKKLYLTNDVKEKPFKFLKMIFMKNLNYIILIIENYCLNVQ